MRTIANISKYVDKLSVKERDVFHRIYTIIEGIGTIKIPKEMKEWTISHFKKIENVEKQHIIRVDNNITFDTCLFNEIRSMRPLDSKTNNDLKKIIKEKEGGPFCKPLTGTPADSFGRIKGKSCITAGNIAKYDAAHGLVVFKEHNPLKFSQADIKDYLETAEKWIKTVHKQDKKRNYPYILWNCLWKAGASLVHGHMQTLVGERKHYGEIEKTHIFSEEYKLIFKTDYFKDVFKIHKELGLGFKHKKAEILAHLTPRKDKEVIIMADELKDASEAIYRVLKAYLKMGVESFNMGVYLNPLDKSWKMPVIIRIVDRGQLSNNSTDIAGMELFGAGNVIPSDPFKLAEKIKKEF